jgi:hypothetical protein
MTNFASESLWIWLAVALGLLLVVSLPFEAWVAATLCVAGLFALVLLGVFGLLAGLGWSLPGSRKRAGK